LYKKQLWLREITTERNYDWEKSQNLNLKIYFLFLPVNNIEEKEDKALEWSENGIEELELAVSGCSSLQKVCIKIEMFRTNNVRDIWE
jgi:hypothetical protein